MKMNSKLAALLLSGSMLATMPGCTDGEVVLGAVVVGAAVLCSKPNVDCTVEAHSHYPRHRRPRPHHHHHYDANGEAVAEETAQDAFVSDDARVIKVAEKYDISDYAATYVVRAVLLAQAKDMSGVKAIGLDASDMKLIVKGKSLSSEKIEAVSKKLMLDSLSTEQLLVDITKDVQLEKAARGL